MKFYSLFKNIAFSIEPETAHNQSLFMLSKFPNSLATLFGSYKDSHLYSDFNFNLRLKDGNTWSFPVGLAAGLDKNAEAIDFFSKIPFGSVEVGTVTPLPQEGNPKPRMFRLIEEESLLNRMGFNNDGMERVFSNIVKSKREGKVLGVNLGKNKLTPQDKAADDYRSLFRKFENIADYLVINVSSPNTPGLRDLQNIECLKEIFDSLDDLRANSKVPLYLKVSPDLSLDDLPPIIELAESYKLAGIIATNTTINSEIGVGGVSGKLLKTKSYEVRKRILEIIGQKGSLELIGVGGISCYDDLKSFWKIGGKVCQIYTSFIYQGPDVLFSIRKNLADEMRNKGMKKLSEFIESLRD